MWTGSLLAPLGGAFPFLKPFGGVIVLTITK